MSMMEIFLENSQWFDVWQGHKYAIKYTLWKVRYSEFFWSVFSPNAGKYRPEKLGHEYGLEYGHFSRSDNDAPNLE